MPHLVICRDAADLAVRAADLVIERAAEAVQERERFTLVLSGGSTPAKTYDHLAQPAQLSRMDWSKAYLFLGDERFVPPDDERSNFAMVWRTLLARVPVPAAQVFPIPTQGRSAAECAAAYADMLTRFAADSHATSPPQFDLILLGLGDDGHTASLFPGAEALGVRDAWVTWSRPGTLSPHVDRITLTYAVLNAARHVVFLVSGERKAETLRKVLEGPASPEQCPAAGVRPTAGTVTWLVDEAAGHLLTRRELEQPS